MNVTKREARFRAMKLESIRLHVEWLYWRQRSGCNRPPRISKREARDNSPPPDDDLRGWQHLLESELRSLGRQHGLTSVPEVAISRIVPNAASDGVRIHMNPVWASETTTKICGNDGACKRALVRGIVAHELAHHLRDGEKSNSHEEELRADAWAARALTLFGVDVEPYIRLVGVGPEQSSDTHPPPSRRRQTIQIAAAAAGAAEPTCEACEACETAGHSQATASCVCSEEA